VELGDYVWFEFGVEVLVFDELYEVDFDLLLFGVCGVVEVILMIVEEFVIELVLVEVFVLLLG